MLVVVGGAKGLKKLVDLAGGANGSDAAAVAVSEPKGGSAFVLVPRASGGSPVSVAAGGVKKGLFVSVAVLKPVAVFRSVPVGNGSVENPGTNVLVGAPVGNKSV